MQSADDATPNQTTTPQAADDATPNETTPPQAADTLKQLENLIAESLQLYELENQKINTTDELVNSLKVITEYLSFSVNIYPDIFDLPSTTQVLLLPTLNIMIKQSNGKTEQKNLDQFPPEKITKILEFIIPLLVNMIQKEKNYLTEKVSFLRAATKQLKQLGHLNEVKQTPQQLQTRGEEIQNV